MNEWQDMTKWGKRSITFVRGRSAHKLAADMGAGHNVRAPHHTVGEIGIVGELALAAGGVLYLEDIEEFRLACIRSVARIWVKMDPEARPAIVARVSDDEAGRRAIGAFMEYLPENELGSKVPVIDVDAAEGNPWKG